MTSRKRDAPPPASREGDADASIRRPNLRALQVLQKIAEQDPEQQRRDWKLFRAAIDEDRALDVKHYPWPDE
jgi:hypothetical protein